METPAPTATDPDTVVTALETAAIFAAKGDSQEAARWLKRAGDSATDAGDGMRALALYRRADELSLMRAPSEEAPREKRLPSPPPRRPSVTPPPPSVRPAPPSERHARTAEADSQPMLLVRPAAIPTPPSIRASAPPKPAGRSMSPPAGTPAASRPLAVRTAPLGATAPRSNAVRAPSQAPAKPSTRPSAPAGARSSVTPASPGVRAVSAAPARAATPARDPEDSAVREAPPKSSVESESRPSGSSAVAAAPPASAAPDEFEAFRLKAARAILTPKPGAKQRYELELLEDGAAIPAGSLGALVVLLDPPSAR